MRLCIDSRSWFKCCRTEIFSPKVLRLYPAELYKLIRLVVRVSRTLGIDRYLLMHVFEVFWSVYLGPVMPWSATCSNCLVYQLGACLGKLNPVACILRKSAAEAERIRSRNDDKIVVKVYPETAVHSSWL